MHKHRRTHHAPIFFEIYFELSEVITRSHKMAKKILQSINQSIKFINKVYFLSFCLVPFYICWTIKINEESTGCLE